MALPKDFHLMIRLRVYEDGRLVAAPEADQAVARGYAGWTPKGAWIDGRRITIMTEKARYAVGEEVRVVHFVESDREGDALHTMGPKEVRGEVVDGVPRGAPFPPGDDPLGIEHMVYDGPAIPAPYFDCNLEITSYRFDEPGTHTIVWRMDALVSNTLRLEVEP